MEKITAARQYAKALFESSQQAQQVEQVEQELKVVANMLKTETEASKILEHPEIPFDEKYRLLTELVPKEVSAKTIAFIKLLLEHRLLELLPEIVIIFSQLRQEAFGILKALVETARPLSDISKQKLHSALTGATRRQVIIDEQVKPDLIGGVRIHIGDKIIDGSIAGKLQQIKEAITQNA